MEPEKILGKRKGRGYQMALSIEPTKAQAFADALYALLLSDPLRSKSEWIIASVIVYAANLCNSKSTDVPSELP